MKIGDLVRHTFLDGKLLGVILSISGKTAMVAFPTGKYGTIWVGYLEVINENR